MDKYYKSGKKWSEEEDEQLHRLYNVENKDIGDICEKHNRFIGGISARLIGKGIINDITEVRGYKEFIKTEKYKEMKECKKKSSLKKNVTQKDKVLITINEEDYNELKEELINVNQQLFEIKKMIQKLNIYDFDE